MKQTYLKFVKLIAVQAVILVAASNIAGYLGSLLISKLKSPEIEPSASQRNDILAEKRYFKESRDYKSYGVFHEGLKSFTNYPYQSFIGWRLGRSSTKAINIDQNGVRSTPILAPVNSDEKIWILGGSTVWGYAVADSQTIPSYVQKMTSLQVVNLGEQAYTSRQSLNLLLNELVKAKLDKSLPNLIIEYSGVNDAIFPCTTDADHPFVHSRESQIKSALSALKVENSPDGIGFFRGLYTSLFPGIAHFRLELSSLKSKPTRSSIQISNKRCLSPEFANRVALNLVQSWDLMHTYLSGMNIKYYAILQPNPYFDPGYQGDINPDYQMAVKQIYPLVQRYAKGKSWFIDGSNWFTTYDKPAWVDHCCHTNPEANMFIADQIIKQLVLKQAINSPM